MEKKVVDLETPLTEVSKTVDNTVNERHQEIELKVMKDPEIVEPEDEEDDGPILKTEAQSFFDEPVENKSDVQFIPDVPFEVNYPQPEEKP